MIHIESNWYIDADKYGFVLQKYNGTRTDKDGKEIEVWTDQKYYSTLKKALAGYFRVKSRNFVSSEDREIKDAIKELDKHYTALENKLNDMLREEEEDD